MELYLKRDVHGFSPDDEISEDELKKIKLNSRVLCKITRQNNPDFHRKLWALFIVGYRYWVPAEIECKYGTPEKNFDRFRKDCTILAGFYDIHHRIDGSFRVEAKSISFGKMEQDDREKLFSAIIDVLLKNIFVGYTEQAVIDMAAQEILNFT